MYGPNWPFLLMYESHDIRHIGFQQVDGLSRDPRDLGRHNKWDGDHFVEGERNKKERKEKGKGKEGKKEKKKKRRRKMEKRKSTFRRSELIGPRSKVCIFDEGDAPRGSDSSYFGLFFTIRAMGLCLCPKGLFGQISKYGNAALF